ncbi:MAG: hypothetical protein QOI95_3093 [Acidimicrobiaceae bacterium]|jgi:hypothetical protein
MAILEGHTAFTAVVDCPEGASEEDVEAIKIAAGKHLTAFEAEVAHAYVLQGARSDEAPQSRPTHRLECWADADADVVAELVSAAHLANANVVWAMARVVDAPLDGYPSLRTEVQLDLAIPGDIGAARQVIEPEIAQMRATRGWRIELAQWGAPPA